MTEEEEKEEEKGGDRYKINRVTVARERERGRKKIQFAVLGDRQVRDRRESNTQTRIEFKRETKHAREKRFEELIRVSALEERETFRFCGLSLPLEHCIFAFSKGERVRGVKSRKERKELRASQTIYLHVQRRRRRRRKRKRRRQATR